MQWITVKNRNECKQVFLAGEKNRITASTMMNITSSRSHAILIVKLEKKLYNEEILENIDLSKLPSSDDVIINRSQLYLVDLAGSERVKKTKSNNQRLEEAKKINYSLLVLGKCIQALSEKKNSYICYRESKLTRLLQESLGGNAKTSLIVTISPSSYNTEETVSSLSFGQRAMKVQNKPILNKFIDYEKLCKKLQEDLDKLNDDYLNLKLDNDKLLEENKVLKCKPIKSDKFDIMNVIEKDENSSSENLKSRIFILK